MRHLPVAVSLVLLVALSAPAADQTILGKVLLVKDPGNPAKRKVVVLAVEKKSPDTIVGDPTATGARLTVQVEGTTASAAAYELPAGDAAAFWSGDAAKGFKYKDAKGENGPVKAALLKKTKRGVFKLKAVLLGKLGSRDVTPPADGTAGCAVLEITGGDAYGVQFNDGKIKNKGPKLFKVTKPATEGTCALCGNGIVDAGEQCDGSACGAFGGSCQADCTCTCDFLDPADCLLPFPSDFLTVADETTDTGRRVHFAVDAMPRNAGGTPVDPTPYRASDGFSPGTSIILRVPNVDLAMTGAAPITDVERSLDPDAPVVVVNAATGARHLLWVELDANASTEAVRATIIRPAVNFEPGARYIVALRNLKDGSGAVLAPTPAFLAYRDDTPSGDPVVEARRAHMEALFTALAAAGIARDDLHLAWDFTVASTRNTTERLLFIRDDGFARLGNAAPPFAVTMVEDEVDSRIFRRVTGTYDVERYVDSTTAPAVFVLDEDGLPTHQPTPQPASFTCIVPRAALADAAATAVPARAAIYGHGLLGSENEVGAGNVRDMANEHNFVFCATKWIGMANEDVPNAIAILQDASKFPSFADRQQQSMLNQLFLARLMIHPDGFASDPAFQDAAGASVLDDSDVFFDGNSQGGIFGGTLMAIAQDITRGVLGVPGIRYSLLLRRSVDFDVYALIYEPAYPNELQQVIGLSLIQMLWDRSEPNGYVRYIQNDPLPDTPSHRVLLHVAFGDHQVANVSTEIEARTIGASIHQPAIGVGRHSDVDPYFGIPAIPGYPFDGSALVIWDSGAPTPPIENVAPRMGDDPHGDPRSDAAARMQKSEFLKTNGAVVDVCAGMPCLAP
jgi:hypothetical protein